jgi:hypothetical protein
MCTVSVPPLYGMNGQQYGLEHAVTEVQSAHENFLQYDEKKSSIV